ncbi:MAG: hypothetical protein ABI609_13260 [Acidobacteriota bacterium]
MTRSRPFRLALRASALALTLIGGQASFGAQDTDPFYSSLLQSGESLYDQGRAAAAAKELRVACFGMLDRPPLLARCLVRLGLAQGDSGDRTGFHETFMRLLDLESHGPAYAKADLTPPIKAAFERQVAQHIPAATLAGSPTFQSLTAGAKPADEKKKGRHPAPVAAPTSPEPAPQAAAPPGGVPPPAGNPPAPTAHTQPAPATPPVATAPPAPAVNPHPNGLSPADQATLSAARETLRTAKTVNDLQNAAASVQRLSDAHLGAVEAASLAGEIAYRSSAWPAAVTYLRRSGPPADQPLLSFYLAVSLYESGDREAAKRTLRPLLPRLQRTPYVEAYIAKILPGETKP